MVHGQMTWIDAIVKVLRDAGEPMDYSQVAQAIIDEGLRDVNGIVSPALSVNATVSQYLKNQGDRCDVVRVKRGQLGLKEWGRVDLRAGVQAASSSAFEVANFVSDGGDLEVIEGSSVDDVRSEGLIACYGMYWRRDRVRWKHSPCLLGAQQLGAKVVDFATQVGVYVLYDGSRVVYVGQVSAQRLGVRLFEHTRDRLNGRWQRFSWFGLLPVLESGELGSFSMPSDLVTILVDTLEAILIEVVEPVQNRRVGNGFSAIEYLQIEDPDIAASQQRALAMKILDRRV